MSVPRIGAKMSANAAPTQAPAQRPATSDDQDPLLLSADDHEVLLLSGDDQALSIEDEPDGDPIDEKASTTASTRGASQTNALTLSSSSPCVSASTGAGMSILEQ